MKILAVGDVVGQRAVEYLSQNLRRIREKENVDFVIANGENAAEIHGISPALADELFAAGADLITLGNHTWSRRDIYSYLDDNASRIIRPANYPGNAPGVGHTVVSVNGCRILCINVLGQVFMDPVGDPFDSIEYVLSREEGEYDVSVLDVHAEATSEKYAIARVFDGKINVIFGTHTHVPTSDLSILPGGSAYVTDLGMTGPVNGILGTAQEPVLTMMRMHMPARFTVADGPVRAHAVLFELEGSRVLRAKRLSF